MLRCGFCSRCSSSPCPLRAGVVYDFVTTIETPRFSSRQTGRVAVEGQSYRADLDGRGSRDIDVVISRDGDQTAVYVDLRRCSWSYRNRIGPIRSSGFFHLPSDEGDAVIGEPVVGHRIEGVETIAGFAATKHVIDIRYRLVGVLADTAVRGSVVARATIWTVDTLPPFPCAAICAPAITRLTSSSRGSPERCTE
ncbi:MAG: hypothetical protein ACXW29_00715 [Thermoanaerobaculia bacterium]